MGPPSIADLKKTQCKAAALGTSWLAHRLGHPRGARRTDTDNAKLWAVTLAMLTAVPLVALVAFAAFTALPQRRHMDITERLLFLASEILVASCLAILGWSLAPQPWL